MTTWGEAEPTSVDSDSMSERVVRTVAAAEGTLPEEIDDRLYDVIDPDALDRIDRTGSPDVALEFPFRGRLITAHGDGSVEVSSVARGHAEEHPPTR